MALSLSQVDRYIDDIVGTASPPSADALPPDDGLSSSQRLHAGDIFYCDRDYFRGMLIRRHRRTALEHDLKVYVAGSAQSDNNRHRWRNWLNVWRQHCGPDAVLVHDNCDHHRLRRSVLDEMHFVRSDSKNRTKNLRVKRAQIELRTDVNMLRTRSSFPSASGVVVN